MSFRKVLKYLFSAFLFLILFFLGFAKEFVSEALNSFIELINTLPANPGIDPIKNLAYNYFFFCKWIVTGLFLLACISTGTIIIQVVFNDKKYTLLCLGIYIAIFFIAMCVQFLGSYLIGYSGSYALAHRITNFIQSILPVLLMIIGRLSFNKDN